MIQLSDICVTFGKENNRIDALKNVSLEVRQGEFLAVMGKSGCGKSTLLNVIGGVLKPTKGSYLFEGNDVSAFSGKQMAEFRNRNIGFIVQNFALVNEMTVRENIMLPLAYAKVKRSEAVKRTEEAMERLGIIQYEYSFPAKLSGGERQRVAIARSIAADTSVILADEPTGSLDEATGRAVIDIFKELNREGKTIIMVTHDRELAEQGTRMLTMKDGELLISMTLP
ncbi:MAG: ABC transporter ATP-binding protein [Clostridia bacterium]|nr:ABC transporter ATP-binding protein [Clostridia bacterium]